MAIELSTKSQILNDLMQTLSYTSKILRKPSCPIVSKELGLVCKWIAHVIWLWINKFYTFYVLLGSSNILHLFIYPLLALFLLLVVHLSREMILTFCLMLLLALWGWMSLIFAANMLIISNCLSLSCMRPFLMFILFWMNHLSHWSIRTLLVFR